MQKQKSNNSRKTSGSGVSFGLQRNTIAVGRRKLLASGGVIFIVIVKINKCCLKFCINCILCSTTSIVYCPRRSIKRESIWSSEAERARNSAFEFLTNVFDSNEYENALSRALVSAWSLIFFLQITLFENQLSGNLNL